VSVPNFSPLVAVEDLINAVEPARAIRLVGIGGPGGSGKSTLAAALAERRHDVQIVPTDSFWNGSQFDLPRLRVQVLDRLLTGETATYDEWDWANKRLNGVRRVEPVGVVVIEGVCALHEMFRHDLDVRVWIDTPDDVRLARGVARDGESMRSTWTEVWMPAEAAYMARDNPTACAHLRLNGTLPY
jgi:uridine kinase